MTRPFRIVFDGRYIRSGQHDGISRYSVNLIAGLARLVEEREDLSLVVLVWEKNQRDRIPYQGHLECHTLSRPTSAREPFVALAINALRPDVVFSPMQTMGSFGRRYRLVLTVHDLIYYSHPAPPREFSFVIRGLWRLYHTSWWPQRMLLRGADAVVAVSNTTRNLLLRHRLTSRPVYVVSNAATPASHESVPAFSERARRLVYMGSFMPYKNVETLVRALSLLPDMELRLLSKISPEDRVRLASLAPKARLTFLDGCSDERYVAELRESLALVSASKDEGFGIPLVESMAQGTPIVVSDIEIFREIGGDAALFASPDSAEEFADRVAQLESKDTWKRASAASILQAKRFSWDRSARDLLDVLLEIGNAEGARNP